MFQINSLFFGNNSTLKLNKFTPKRKSPDRVSYPSVSESFIKTLNLTDYEHQIVINHLKIPQLFSVVPKRTNYNMLHMQKYFSSLYLTENQRQIICKYLKIPQLFSFTSEITHCNKSLPQKHKLCLADYERQIVFGHLKNSQLLSIARDITNYNLLQMQKRYRSTKSSAEPTKSSETENTSIKSQIKSFLKTLALMVLISSCFIYFNDRVGQPFDSDTLKIEDVKLDDVIGCDEVKADIQSIVKFLKDPEKFDRIGARIPKGILLVGDPGVGKTMITKAIATEAGVNIFIASGSDFEHMFVGSGAAKVMKLFNKARAHAPSIILIDEIDSLCRKRTYSSLSPYANQTINQFLAEMDGMKENDNVIVIGTTNRLEAMDKAAIRPGRFDQCLHIFNPEFKDRMTLFKHYIAKVKHEEFNENQIETIGRITLGKTGAHISHMVNEAGIIAVKNGHNKISMDDLLEADDQISMGLKRKRATDENMNKRLACKEAGRVIVSYYSPNSIDKVKLASIIERGDDRPSSSFVFMKEGIMSKKNDYLYLIDKHMGVRVAEELVFGIDNVSTDTYRDVNEASRFATLMVQKLTFADSVGIEDYRSTSCQCGCSNISDKKLEEMDDEINKLLLESYHRVKALINDKRSKLDKLAEYLLKYDTLNQKQIDYILSDKSIINSIFESMIGAASSGPGSIEPQNI